MRSDEDRVQIRRVSMRILFWRAIIVIANRMRRAAGIK